GAGRGSRGGLQHLVDLGVGLEEVGDLALQQARVLRRRVDALEAALRGGQALELALPDERVARLAAGVRAEPAALGEIGVAPLEGGGFLLAPPEPPLVRGPAPLAE